MKNSDIKNLINGLHLESKTRDDLMDKILNRNFIYKKDVIDYILIYISYMETRIQNILFCDLSLNLSLPRKYLIARCNWLKAMGLEGVQLHKNHMQIYKIFDNLNILFSENNIEHYYTSGILAFILSGKNLERYHHDIDVFVNEKDLINLEKVSSHYGFLFFRQFGIRKDGTKRIMIKMQVKNIDIPITIFMYEKEKDNSITQKDYYYDLQNNLMVEFIYNNSLSAKLSFDDNVKYFHNHSFKAISLEALYLCKRGGRLKDEYDCEMFKDFVDQEKLNKLICAIDNNKPNKSTLLKDFLKIKFLTKQHIKDVQNEY